MKRKHVNILLVEDDEDDIILIKEYLKDSNYFTFSLEADYNLESVKQKLQDNQYNICLVDYRLGRYSGLDLIKYVRENNVRIPVILLTGQGDRDVDIEAMESGAHDYLVKNHLDSSSLERSIRYALSHDKALKELDLKERRYRTLFERSIDPIFLMNAERHLVDFNRSLISLFKYSPEDLLGRDLATLFFSEDEFTEFNRLLLKNNQVRDFEVTLVSSEGHKIPSLLNCIFVPDDNHSASCFQCIIHDLTIRKKMEREKITTEKLMATGNLARSIAHEVRNPLTSLSLALDQLKSEIEESEMVGFYLDIINRNAGRIGRLISDLLNSAKVKDLKLKVTPVEEVLEETIQLVIDRIKLKNMRLVKNIEEGIFPINIDKEEVKTAFVNICINAIEAMEENEGILTVEAALARDQVLIRITDNGSGIEEQHIGKLFDAFYTGKKGGMGLGLTTTQNILAGHNAGVEVSSRLGEGTTFTIMFDAVADNIPSTAMEQD